MNDKIERLIKNYLEKQPRPAGQRQLPHYPEPLELYRYLTDELQGGELEKMLNFLRNNEEGQVLVRSAREIMEKESGWEKESVPPDWIKVAKKMGAKSQNTVCPHCGKPFTPFKKPLASQKWMNLAWLVLAAASFALSFVFRRYFMQFLVASTLAGIKAIVELRATKTHILIYKALSDEPSQYRLQDHSSRL